MFTWRRSCRIDRLHLMRQVKEANQIQALEPWQPGSFPGNSVNKQMKSLIDEAYPELSKTMTDEEKAGVEAIICLQGSVGVTETAEKALSSWRAFTPGQRRFTMATFDSMCK
jgi:hypothetical protein